MPSVGLSKPQQVNLPSNGIDEEQYVLGITYRGRDWLIFTKADGNFKAMPTDNKHSNIHQAKKVMEYLLKEGFISPNEDQQMSVKP